METRTYSRSGMTVKEMIKILEKIEDKDRFVACTEAGFGGITGVTEINEIEVGGYAGRYSFEFSKIVLIG